MAAVKMVEFVGEWPQGAPTSFEDIRSDGDGASYPRHILAGCDNALILFAAGFFGRQDGFWIADAGLRATCVDIRPDLLAAMERVYPYDWEFVEGDVFEYVANTGRQWDLLSIDCPSTLFERCAAQVATWTRLARVAVVLGTSGRTDLAAPDGWEVTERRFRSVNYGGTFWAVLERK